MQVNTRHYISDILGALGHMKEERPLSILVVHEDLRLNRGQ